MKNINKLKIYLSLTIVQIFGVLSRQECARIARITSNVRGALDLLQYEIEKDGYRGLGFHSSVDLLAKAINELLLSYEESRNLSAAFHQELASEIRKKINSFSMQRLLRAEFPMFTPNVEHLKSSLNKLKAYLMPVQNPGWELKEEDKKEFQQAEKKLEEAKKAFQEAEKKLEEAKKAFQEAEKEFRAIYRRIKFKEAAKELIMTEGSSMSKKLAKGLFLLIAWRGTDREDRAKMHLKILIRARDEAFAGLSSRSTSIIPTDADIAFRDLISLPDRVDSGLHQQPVIRAFPGINIVKYD